MKKHTGPQKPPGEAVEGHDLPNRGFQTGRRTNDQASDTMFSNGFDVLTEGLDVPDKTISYDDGDEYPNYARMDTEFNEATGEEETFDRYRGGFLPRYDENDTGREDQE